MFRYTVTWGAVSTATHYELQEKVSNSWTNVYSGSGTQLELDGRPAGSYPYRVKACRNSTCSTFSAEVIVQVQAATCIPAPPAGISVAPDNSTDGDFTVSWSASPPSCVTSYQLQESYNQTAFQIVPLTSTQIQQRSWSPNPPKSVSGSYVYNVRACGGTQCSGWTVGPGVTVSLQVSLTVPTGLQACRVGGVGSQCAVAGSTLNLLAPLHGVNYRVSWNPVQGATSYQYKLTSSSNEFPAPITGSPQPVNNAYVDGQGNPTNWMEHTYKVRACAGADSTCSAWTDLGVTIRIEKNNPLRPTVASATYIHTDALGSPVAETNALGVVIKRTAYQPWGVPADGIFQQGPGYTGHVTDALTELSYMQQRYYDPAAGRFLSVDPVEASPGSFNRYWYANNKPYGNIDPDGRKACGKDTTCALEQGAAGYSTAAVYGAYGASNSQKAIDARTGSEVRRVGAREVRKYNPSSISRNAEYGGFIYKMRGRVKATPPEIGSCGESKVTCEVDIAPSLGAVPKGATIVGDYHTHGNGEGDANLFSPADINASNSSPEDLRMRGFSSKYFGSFLGTPNGKAYFYKYRSLPNNPLWDDIPSAMKEL